MYTRLGCDLSIRFGISSMIAEEHNGRRVEEAWCVTLTLPRVQSVRMVSVLVDLGRHDLFLHFPLSPLHTPISLTVVLPPSPTNALPIPTPSCTQRIDRPNPRSPPRQRHRLKHFHPARPAHRQRLGRQAHAPPHPPVRAPSVACTHGNEPRRE